MWVFKALSALLFMTGWMAIAVAAVVSWLYVAVHITISLGWFAGAIFMVGSLAAVVCWEDYVKMPFLFWLQLWQYADRILLDRNR